MKRDYVPLFQQICTSGRMADLSGHAPRLFYVLLLTQCDSWGRVTADPRALTALVWGTFGETVKGTERALTELERNGLIAIYESEDRSWIQIPDWEEKAGSVGRVDRRGNSRYPDPSPDLLRTKSGLTPGSAVVTRDLVRTEERREEREERRGEGEQRKAEERIARGRAAASPPSSSWPVPESLDVPPFREVWTDWIQYRVEKKNPMTATGSKQLLTKCAKLGPTLAATALRESMANGWTGVFPERISNGRSALDAYPDLSKPR